jgi:hypothetical protein
MAGILVFEPLAQAVRARFELYEQTEKGYVVRMRTPGGWGLALVAHPAAARSRR